MTSGMTLPGLPHRCTGEPDGDLHRPRDGSGRARRVPV